MNEIKKSIAKLANPERAKVNAWFFKTGIGQYGEGDKFAGLTVPQCREIAKKFLKLDLREIKQLLNSGIHEERLISVFILVDKFQKSNDRDKNEIFDFYVKNSEKINNWDLVDASADKIVGAFLSDKDRKVLYDLAKSKNLWRKRIAIIATFYFIKFNKEYNDTFKISEILMSDKHDLIQKAVGWMLREAGKRVSEKEEIKFLKKHYKAMPRTMLRYAIERFDPKLKEDFMKGRL